MIDSLINWKPLNDEQMRREFEKNRSNLLSIAPELIAATMRNRAHIRYAQGDAEAIRAACDDLPLVKRPEQDYIFIDILQCEFAKREARNAAL